MTTFVATLRAMRYLQFLVVLALASPAWAANFATCILDNLPGTANQSTHGAVFQACVKKFPEMYSTIPKGSGRGLLGFRDGNTCTIKKAKSTPFDLSAMQIGFACKCLYDEPNLKGATCTSDFDPTGARPVN